MFYAPPASYYEPPCKPSYDRTFVQTADNLFVTVSTYDNGEVFKEEETAEDIRKYYNDLHEEEGLVKFEVYEIVKEIGATYGKHEDDYYEEVIEEGEGRLLYSEKF